MNPCILKTFGMSEQSSSLAAPYQGALKVQRVLWLNPCIIAIPYQGILNI